MPFKLTMPARLDLIAGLTCAALGMILATAPNFNALARHGTLVYFADSDETFYLGIARAPYYGEARLRDPYLPASAHVPTLHSWVMFGPWAWLDRSLGLPLVGLSFLWRACGGILFGAAVYVLHRRLLAGTAWPIGWAFGCAVICLADAGFNNGRTLLAGFVLLKHVFAGTTPLYKPDAIPQYRVVTPLLNLPFFLLLAAVVSAPRMPGRRGVCCGMAALAACIYLYFYFWTAAVVALGLYSGLNLVLAVFGAADKRPARCDAARFAALVLAGGLILGAPQILGTAAKGTDPALRLIFERISKGYTVPRGRLFQDLYLVNYTLGAKLLFGALGLTFLKVRGTGFLWTSTLVGYLLTNSALITGKEFENFHWSYCHTACSEIMVLVTAAQWIDRRAIGSGRRVPLRWLYVVPASYLALALVWRPYEASHAPEAREFATALQDMRPLEPSLRALGPDFVLAGPSPQINVALLLSRCALLNHRMHLMNLALISDQEIHERDALDAWLRGLEPAVYDQTYLPILDEKADLRQFGFTAVDDPRWPRAAIRAERKRLFQTLLAGDTTLLGRFPVDGLLRPTADGPPPRGGPWIRRADGGRWSLWVRP